MQVPMVARDCFGWVISTWFWVEGGSAVKTEVKEVGAPWEDDTHCVRLDEPVIHRLEPAPDLLDGEELGVEGLTIRNVQVSHHTQRTNRSDETESTHRHEPLCEPLVKLVARRLARKRHQDLEAIGIHLAGQVGDHALGGQGRR